MHAPMGGDDKDCLDWATGRLASTWPGGSFALTIDRATNILEPELVIVATGTELSAAIKRTQNSDWTRTKAHSQMKKSVP